MPVLTIDTIWLILRRSIFNPFIAWLSLLCLHAVQTPPTSPKYTLVTLYATLLTACHILLLVSHRIAHGAPRSVVPEDEVALITGGSSGLGRTLAQRFSRAGLSVVVLDLQAPADLGEEEAQNVHFYPCDVSDPAAVERVKGEVERDIGRVTILINNAGVVTGRPLLQTPPARVTRSIGVNLLAHFHTLAAFLPGMLEAEHGGTVVTVSSVLGKLGAAGLTDYAAAKAGLIAMHASLRAELKGMGEAGGRVKMVLVTPGQLGTGLFAGVETPSGFLGPVVEPVALAKEIVTVVLNGDGGDVSLPLYAAHIEWMHVLPAGLQVCIRWLSGVDRAMKGFGSVQEDKKER